MSDHNRISSTFINVIAIHHNPVSDVIESTVEESLTDEEGKRKTTVRLEEYLTKKLIKTYSEKQIKLIDRTSVLTPWMVELSTIARYADLLRIINLLTKTHGDNTQVFGPAKAQELVVDFSRPKDRQTGRHSVEMKVGMKVDNLALNRALSCSLVGIGVTGDLITTGTIVRFENLLAMIADKVHAYVESMPRECRRALADQWNIVVSREIAEAGSHFGCPGYGRLDDYMDTAAILAHLDIATTTLYRYRNGHVPAGYAPFPKPDKFHGRSPYWHRTSISAWSNSKK